MAFLKLLLNVFHIQLLSGISVGRFDLSSITPDGEIENGFFDSKLNVKANARLKRNTTSGVKLVEYIEDHPYMATVVYESPGPNSVKKQCTATIVHGNYIITPGSCVTDCKCKDGTCLCKDYPANRLSVYVGSVKSNTGSKLSVKDYYLHPKFKQRIFSKKCRNEYNLAVIQLTVNIVFEHEVANVRIPPAVDKYKNMTYVRTSRYIDNAKNCTLIGWFDSENTKSETFLKSTSVRLSNVDKCNDKYSVSMCPTTQICTVVPARVCGRDVGGALLCNGMQVAMVTELAVCTKPDWPIEYIRLDVNVKWIQDVLENLYDYDTANEEIMEKLSNSKSNHTVVSPALGSRMYCNRIMYVYVLLILINVYCL